MNRILLGVTIFTFTALTIFNLSVKNFIALDRHLTKKELVKICIEKNGKVLGCNERFGN